MRLKTSMDRKSGLVMDMRVGESICLRGINGVDSEKIVLILESKDGRKARVRIQASQSVKVVRPEKQTDNLPNFRSPGFSGAFVGSLE